jgi:hypothetical protein
MNKIMFTAAIILGSLTQNAMADEGAVIHRTKKISHCCGPYAPCGVRCQLRCPSNYSCYSLYGAYGPHGGARYWGAYTYTGWGY